MSKVVDLGQFKAQKPEIVWMCGECGGQTFLLTEEGGIRCRVCNLLQRVPDEWLDKANEARNDEEE